MPKATRTTSLFSRLLFYFLIITIIPLVIMSVYYSTMGRQTMLRNLKQEAEQTLSRSSDEFNKVIEEYRHKAYLLSTNDTVIETLRKPLEVPSQIYQELFGVMNGDIYKATGSVVSMDGRARFSTHLFPSSYDLRYNTSDWSAFYSLSRASSETASMLSLSNRYRTESNSIVVMNILRRVFSEYRNQIGYAAVDIYLESFSSVNKEKFFSDLIIIDTSSYLATSLVNSENYGDMSNFPQIELSSIYDTYEKDNTIVTQKRVEGTPFLLVGILDYRSYETSFDQLFLVEFAVLAVGFALSALFAGIFSRSVAKPVKDLNYSMKQAKSGELGTRVSESSIKEINELDRSFNSMLKRISNLMLLNKEEEEKLRQSERKALEAQINPHFLYNTLNTIKSLARLHGEEDIYTIAVRLGKLLRSSINNMENESSLKESFELVESYLAIQQIRFQDRLEVSIEKDPLLDDIKTPKLIIQPFVENAIVHGLEPKTGQWKLEIKAHLEDNSMVRITIKDNGVGFKKGIIPDNLEDFASTSHNGIYNVYRRLQLYYGDKAKVDISSEEGMGTVTTLVFPKEK